MKLWRGRRGIPTFLFLLSILSKLGGRVPRGNGRGLAASAGNTVVPAQPGRESPQPRAGAKRLWAVAAFQRAAGSLDRCLHLALTLKVCPFQILFVATLRAWQRRRCHPHLLDEAADSSRQYPGVPHQELHTPHAAISPPNSICASDPSS